MVRSETPEPAGGDQSLGDLVALAAKDVSQLVRYEIDLAKTELRDDVRRVATAAVLIGGSAFAGCLILVMLCFALAEGLVALGLSRWEAFLAVAVAPPAAVGGSDRDRLPQGGEHDRPAQDTRNRHRGTRDAAS